MIKKCPQCKSELREVRFDIGYDIEVDSLNCKKCGFNITKNKELTEAVNRLRDSMSKEVKIIRIGEGLGLRFPNNIIKEYRLKRGREVLLKPEIDGIKIVNLM